MKKLEYGRSMVEMLGVLAIIGVLSVGAIAGYQKAMMKYKLNKQTQQLSQLLNVMHRYNDSWMGLQAGEILTPYLDKLNEIPKEMIKDESGILYDVFQNRTALSTSFHFSKFGVVFEYEIKNNKAFEICQNFINIAKEHSSYLHDFYIGSSGKSIRFYGDKYCNRTTTADDRCANTITNDDIYEVCQRCEQAEGCYSIIYS